MGVREVSEGNKGESELHIWGIRGLSEVYKRVFTERTKADSQSVLKGYKGSVSAVQSVCLPLPQSGNAPIDSMWMMHLPEESNIYL